ncbi:MAG: alpha/beta hydrolase [SAR324 cluster bacterium]|nr:alpha/beta hydrolase [SAR324 cluster bacterium]
MKLKALKGARRLAGFAAVVLLVGACAGGGQLQVVKTRPNVEQKFWLMEPKPPRKPVAHVILFAGGRGRLGLSFAGISELRGNFLVRTRELWVKEGFSVALPDVPSDTAILYLPRNGDASFRASQEHATDIKHVIQALQSKWDLPVWLVGTSRGTVSASAVAANLPQGMVDGVVLTSSVFQPLESGLLGKMIPEKVRGIRGLAARDLARIMVPTLWVHHKKDACPITMFKDLAGFMSMQTNAPKVELLTYQDGGGARGNPCHARHWHGFPGIEEKVVRDISNWIKANNEDR